MRYGFIILVIVSLATFFSCEKDRGVAVYEDTRTSKKLDTLLYSLKQEDLTKPEKDDLLRNFISTAKTDQGIKQRKQDFKALSIYLYDDKDVNNYVKVSNELQLLSRTMGDSLALARSLNFTGAFYMKENLVDSAFSRYYDASKIYDRLDNALDAGLTWLSMAIIQKRVKDYAGSEASCIKAIEFFKKENATDTTDVSNRYLGSAYNNLGVIAKERGQYDIAIDYCKTALNYRQLVDQNGFLAAGTYNNMGLIYAKSGDFDKAIDFYQKGLDNDKLLESRPKTYARLLDNMAFAMHKEGRRDNVDSLFFRALTIRQELSDISGIGTSNYHIASYVSDKGMTAEAEAYALDALEKLKMAGDNKGVLETLELLTGILPAERALEYAKEYMQLAAQLDQIDRTYQDQFARVRFETDTLLTANIKGTRTIRQLTIAFLGTVVLLLLGYIWKQRLSTKKEKLYQLAQQKSTEEIYSLMLAQSAKIEEGKQLEKKRISEELHDNVLSKLFGIRISLDSVHAKEGGEIVKARAGYLKELQEITQEIRQISHDLNRHSFLREQLFPEVLDGLVTDFGEQAKLECSFSFDKNIQWDEMKNATKAHLYRIIQESLVNAHKHGHAQSVEVSFAQDSTHFTTLVKDDGVGLDLKKLKRGIGLKNIASRTNKINGEFFIHNNEPKGTTIDIRFPRKKV